MSISYLVVGIHQRQARLAAPRHNLCSPSIPWVGLVETLDLLNAGRYPLLVERGFIADHPAKVDGVKPEPCLPNNSLRCKNICA
jgi:hypothetical protein